MRSNRVLLRLAIAATAVLTPACSLLAPDPFPRSALQAGLDRLVETRAASAATLRVREGEHEWAAGAGTEELASSVPVSTSARFRIGSVTKTFVATVVLQLVDEGRLALDDPIAVHLPGAVPGGEAISVRQILNHTSGIYDYAHERDWSTNRWRGDARFRTYRPQELLDVAFMRPPHFPPGQGWHYSNTNYVVAGLLVEKLTGSRTATRSPSGSSGRSGSTRRRCRAPTRPYRSRTHTATRTSRARWSTRRRWTPRWTGRPAR